MAEKLEIYMQQMGLGDEISYWIVDRNSLELAMAIENMTGKTGFTKYSAIYYRLLGDDIVKTMIDNWLIKKGADDKYYFTERAWKWREEFQNGSGNKGA